MERREISGNKAPFASTAACLAMSWLCSGFYGKAGRPGRVLRPAHGCAERGCMLIRICGWMDGWLAALHDKGSLIAPRWAVVGAGDWSGVREKYCWLAGAGASGWSGVRGK